MVEIQLLHLSDLHVSARPDRAAFPRGVLSKIQANFTRKPDPFHTRLIDFIKPPWAIDKQNIFGSNVTGVTRSVAEFVYKEHASFDAIVITGDLATTGLPADLAEAVYFVDAPCVKNYFTQNGKPSLSSNDLDIFILPGNHDRYEDELGTAGGVEFDYFFQHYWDSNSRTQTFLLSADDGTQFAIVGADFSLGYRLFNWPPINWGFGWADSHTIRELTLRTRDLYNRGCTAVMWAMHYPPINPKKYKSLYCFITEVKWTSLNGRKVASAIWSFAMGKMLTLLNGRRVISAAKKCNISYIMAGHVHKRGRYKVKGVNIICASSSTAVDVEGSNEIHVMKVNIKNGSIIDVNCDDWEYVKSRNGFARV